MGKRAVVFILVLIALVGCGGDSSITNDDTLVVTDGSSEKQYTVDDLERLNPQKAVFREVAYIGVPLSSLLINAGYNLEEIMAVKAVAYDGFTANYEPELITKTDTLVAYALEDGPLTSDDGTFRMVLPGQEGKLNPRQLVELKVYR